MKDNPVGTVTMHQGVVYRSVESWDELRARGVPVVEALAQWLCDRQGSATLRPFGIEPGEQIMHVIILTPTHHYGVTAPTAELAIATVCQRVDALMIAENLRRESREPSL